ncbi:hypothetical protein Daus18300_007995 [Diaporthe australafricana]|uniref:Uncharacterized protein n=1 Tax=Diaporthe australafricana TaxID=127596 RepID=A0ABR3WKN4_9PEZI
MSTKIMIALHKKHANPTKKGLDNATAQLNIRQCLGRRHKAHRENLAHSDGNSRRVGAASYSFWYSSALHSPGMQQLKHLPGTSRSWLESAAKSKGIELETIMHQTRYSDLRKFFWMAAREYTVDFSDHVERLPVPGLDDASPTAARLFPIHPVATLINRNRETLDDLTLEARDCLSL